MNRGQATGRRCVGFTLWIVLSVACANASGIASVQKQAGNEEEHLRELVASYLREASPELGERIAGRLSGLVAPEMTEPAETLFAEGNFVPGGAALAVVLAYEGPPHSHLFLLGPKCDHVQDGVCASESLGEHRVTGLDVLHGRSGRDLLMANSWSGGTGVDIEYLRVYRWGEQGLELLLEDFTSATSIIGKEEFEAKGTASVITVEGREYPSIRIEREERVRTPQERHRGTDVRRVGVLYVYDATNGRYIRQDLAL